MISGQIFDGLPIEVVQLHCLVLPAGIAHERLIGTDAGLPEVAPVAHRAVQVGGIVAAAIAGRVTRQALRL
jgi:hypothetical protein